MPSLVLGVIHQELLEVKDGNFGVIGVGLGGAGSPKEAQEEGDEDAGEEGHSMGWSHKSSYG